MDIEIDLLCYKIFIWELAFLTTLFWDLMCAIHPKYYRNRYMELFRQIKGYTFN
jgi:hypothetical protein